MKQHAFRKKRGWIELICGPMFAGKSEELLKRLKRLDYADVRYLVFKPRIDVRSQEKVKSRDGRESNSIVFDKASEILDYILKIEQKPHVIAIDEAQFADDFLVVVCETLADLGFIIYVSALDNNFKNEPFSVTSKLACSAEYVKKLSAICTECGAPANFTQKLVDQKPAHYSSDVIQIGDTDAYTVRCRHHHKILGKPKDNIVKKFQEEFASQIKNQKEII